MRKANADIKQTIRVLSIDWDYFVVEDPMLDFSHNETAFYLEAIWPTRRIRVRGEGGKLIMEPVDLTERMPFRGSELLLVALVSNWAGYPITTAESHLSILKMLGDATDLEIVNIDAHHDIHYGKPATADNVECGNWGSLLMAQGRVKSWLQVYPPWRRRPEFHETFPRKWAYQHCPQVKVTYGMPVIRWPSVDYVFVCRSGCWAPPEYDARFAVFCEMLGGHPLPPREIPPPLPVTRMDLPAEAA